MCVNGSPWPRPKSRGEGLEAVDRHGIRNKMKGGGKCKGALKKTSGRSYSLERPVARHFVWFVLLHLLYQYDFRRKLLKTGEVESP